MPYTLFTAPDCLRCKIVKEFLADRNITYSSYDFKDNKDVFNAFYRANRTAIYRNHEGVEFPLLHDGGNNILRQGSGEIIAYLLAGHALEPCVRRSELLHGWISGLHVSQCPEELEEAFTELAGRLAKGGLNVVLETDGRKAALLGALLGAGLAARVVLNLLGPADVYPEAVGEELDPDDLAKSLSLVRGHPDHAVRLLLRPVTPHGGRPYYISPAQAAEAARMLCQAGADMQMPFSVAVGPQTADGLERPQADDLLPYRGKLRNHLVKADIEK